MSTLAKNTPTVYKSRTMKGKSLKSIEDIRDAFGVWRHGDASRGKRALAEWTGNSLQAVCNWFTGGQIPTAYHYRLHLWAEWQGYRLDPIAFGLGPDGCLAKLKVAKAA